MNIFFLISTCQLQTKSLEKNTLIKWNILSEQWTDKYSIFFLQCKKKLLHGVEKIFVNKNILKKEIKYFSLFFFNQRCIKEKICSLIEFFPSCDSVRNTVWMHHLDPNEMLWGESWMRTIQEYYELFRTPPKTPSNLIDNPR